MATPSKPDPDHNETVDEPPTDDGARSGRSPRQAVISQELEPGVVVDRYQLISKLGEGGFGVVYLASHKSFPNRRYALKLIRPDRNASEEFSARFSKEIQAMGDLNHSNVVYATDAGEWNGLQYLAMDYVDGVPLSSLVSEKTPLAICDACELVRQAAIGMQHVYEKGRTHRDLKPPNLMLDKSGVVRILDLGLAKLRSDIESVGEPLTAMGQMMGTPDYMAPEQWEDSSTVDIRADIYSLGCTLFCLLTGRAPFGNGEHGSIVAKMRAHTTIAAPDVSTLRPDIPPKLAVIVQTCLEKQPDERFQSPQDLAEALESLAESSNLSTLVASLPTTPSQDQAAVSTAVAANQSTFVPGHGTVPSDSDTARKETSRFKPSMMFGLQIPGRMISLQVGLVAMLAVGLTFWFTGNNGADTMSATLVSPDHSEVEQDDITGDTPGTSAKPKQISAESVESRIRIEHFRAGADRVPEPLGQIGEAERKVLLNDVIRMTVDLQNEHHVMVVALNPNGSIQLCIPASENEPPPLKQYLKFPTESDVYFGLTDGEGQQAFLALTSSEPLPAFSKLRPILESAGWVANQHGGVWQFDGSQVSQVFPARVDRGTLQRLTANEFRSLCLTVKEEQPNMTVLGFAFPVE